MALLNAPVRGYVERETSLSLLEREGALYTARLSKVVVLVALLNALVRGM